MLASVFSRNFLEIIYNKVIQQVGDLKKKFEEASGITGIGFLEYIWEREDISKSEVMPFLLEVMKNNGSLLKVEYAGRYFMKGAKYEKGSPLTYDKWIIGEISFMDPVHCIIDYRPVGYVV